MTYVLSGSSAADCLRTDCLVVAYLQQLHRASIFQKKKTKTIAKRDWRGENGENIQKNCGRENDQARAANAAQASTLGNTRSTPPATAARTAPPAPTRRGAPPSGASPDAQRHLDELARPGSRKGLRGLCSQGTLGGGCNPPQPSWEAGKIMEINGFP